jgi:hypothetical protein
LVERSGRASTARAGSSTEFDQGGPALKKLLVLLVAVFLLSPAPASAQRRRRAPTKKAAPAQPKADINAIVERRDAAARVATQIKSLSQFLYILGGVVKGIEAADKAIQNQEASPQVIEQTSRSKDTVKTSIRNVRAGLNQLETELSGKPSLRPFYHRFLGLSELAATAEQQAEAGQFDQSGRTLLRVIEKLSDGLAAIQSYPQ